MSKQALASKYWGLCNASTTSDTTRIDPSWRSFACTDLHVPPCLWQAFGLLQSARSGKPEPSLGWKLCKSCLSACHLPSRIAKDPYTEYPHSEVVCKGYLWICHGLAKFGPAQSGNTYKAHFPFPTLSQIKNTMVRTPVNCFHSYKSTAQTYQYHIYMDLDFTKLVQQAIENTSQNLILLAWSRGLAAIPYLGSLENKLYSMLAMLAGDIQGPLAHQSRLLRRWLLGCSLPCLRRFEHSGLVLEPLCWRMSLLLGFIGPY